MQLQCRASKLKCTACGRACVCCSSWCRLASNLYSLQMSRFQSHLAHRSCSNNTTETATQLPSVVVHLSLWFASSPHLQPHAACVRLLTTLTQSQSGCWRCLRRSSKRRGHSRHHHPNHRPHAQNHRVPASCLLLLADWLAWLH
jgi:hypothetical protein